MGEMKASEIRANQWVRCTLVGAEADGQVIAYHHDHGLVEVRWDNGHTGLVNPAYLVLDDRYAQPEGAR